MARSLGPEGTERALKEFDRARDSLTWIRDFFRNQLQSFLVDDVKMLKRWSPKNEIRQPPYTPKLIQMAPTVTVGVDAIVSTLDVCMLVCMEKLFLVKILCTSTQTHHQTG